VTHDSPITYGVVKPGEEGDVPFVRGGDIVDGLVRIDQLRTITTTVSQQYKRTLLRGGELLMSLVGQPGQVAVASPTLAGANIARQVGLIRLQDIVDAHFLSYFLRSPDGIAGLGKFTGGSVQQVINLSDLRQVPVPLPPLDEQHRIVTLLDEAFADIATAKANAEKNLQNARDFFAGQLQDVFDAGIDNWNSSTLGLVYDVRDGTHDSPKYHDEGFPLITSKNLKNEGLTFDDVKLISLEDYNKINERSAVHQGDVLLAMIGTIGNPTVVETIPNFAIKNVALLKVPENQNSYFLRYYLSCPSVITKMQAEAKGTTQKFVGLGYLRAFPISVPDLSEQDQMVSRLDELRAETNRLEAIYRQKITALDDLKKSLLYQAFSGQL
jgi:type I restriction enzyme S subunit